MKKSTLLVLSAVLIVAAFALTVSFHFSNRAKAATAVVVTECDVTRQAENTPPTDNWVLYTRAGTPPNAGAFVTGPETPPAGTGSFQTTTATGTEKVFLFNYDHIGTKLTDINEISYSTYRTAGSLQQVTALNIVIDFNGPNVDGGFSTLVFEPVYNTDQGPVVSGVWQDWTATGSGVWWSTRAINNQCAGATASCDKTWAEIVANNPDAVILGGVGINQGGGNAGLIASTDAFTFDETTYDFEADTDSDCVADSKDNCPLNANTNQADLDNDGQGDVCDTDDDNDGVDDGADNCPNTPAGTTVNSSGCPLAVNKDQCKNGGWQGLFRANGTPFKNQGDCIQYANTGK